MMSRLRTSAGRSEPPARSIPMTRRTESGRSTWPVPSSAISSSNTATAKALSAGWPVTAISLPRTWTSVSTSFSTRRSNSSPEPSRATIDTESGTVMVVRTAVGAESPRPFADGAGEPGCPSATAACAEASRDEGAPGTGTFGDESGKNPRPCLPARGGADRSSLPARREPEPPSGPLPTCPSASPCPVRQEEPADHRGTSAPCVGRLPRSVSEEGVDRVAQVVCGEERTGDVGHQVVRGPRALSDGGGDQLLGGRVRHGGAGRDLAGVGAGGLGEALVGQHPVDHVPPLEDGGRVALAGEHQLLGPRGPGPLDRKSTRLNSSHANISYAVFCLKK